MSLYKRLLFFGLLMVNFSLFAQTQWRVVYQYKLVDTDESIKRRDSLNKAHPEFAEAFKKMRKSLSNKVYIMHFDKNESVFKKEEKLEKPISSGGMTIKVMGNDDRVLYKNLSKHIYISKKNSFDKLYRVTDSLPDYHWKITKNSKPIGQYIAIEAKGETFKENRKGKKKKVEVTAWFTPQIPIGNGPEEYSGLPGLILELKAGRNVYLAKEIVVNPKDKKSIKAPTKGEIISQEQYDKQVAEQMKKMRTMRKSYRNRRDRKHR